MTFFKFLFLPFGGILEAVAGLLWPSNDPAVHRLQRITLALLLSGLLALGVAFWIGVLSLLLVAGLCFVGAGLIGNHIESLCKRKP